MSASTSSSTGRKYGLKRVCWCWGIPRSTVYRHRVYKNSLPNKRGPKGEKSDEELLQEIKEQIEKSPFTGEGHRKIHAKIRRSKGINTSPKRILRIMRENKLLSPYRVEQGVKKSHDGKITTDRPCEMWGIDAAKIWTAEDGWVWFFGLVDHWNAECVGWHVSKKGTRFAAVEALLKGIERIYGKSEADKARGLSLRMDHGSQFRSDYFLDQVRYLGIAPSFGFVREPETNGVIERFNRTLKEQAINGRDFASLEELRGKLDRFVKNYNREWLVQKLGYQSPEEARANYIKIEAA